MRSKSTHQFIIAKHWSEIKEAVKHTKKTGYFSHDFETNAEPFHSDESWPTIIGMSFQPGYSIVIPLKHSESPFNKDYINILDYLAENLIINEKITKIGWNLAFEGKWWKKYGWEMVGRNFDAMLAKHLLDEERPHGLGNTVNVMFDEFAGFKDDTELLARQHGWGNIPLQPLAERNALDTDLTLRLMLRFEKNLQSLGLYRLFRSLAGPLRTKVLNDLEFRGINVDGPYLEALSESYVGRIADVEVQLRKFPRVLRYEKSRKRKVLVTLLKEIEEKIEVAKESGNDRVALNAEKKLNQYIAGNITTKKDRERLEPINFGSTVQLADFLFFSRKGLNLDVIKYTKNKQTKVTSDRASVDEEVLLQLQITDKSGFMELLMKSRSLKQLNSTYVQGMLNRRTQDNIIYGNFLVHGTVTGRLSSKDPNLQNIPRGTTAADIKKMFIPPPGYLLIEFDYSQAELRLVAEMAQDIAMIEIFQRDYNIHVATACKINGGIDLYNKVKSILKDENHPDNYFWETQKKFAKTINFGILYGETEYKLAQQLGVSIEEAKEFMNTWFESYPQVTKWIKAQHAFARKNGYVSNVFGRRRRLPDAMYTFMEAKKEGILGFHLEAMRQSVNAPIQGGSSDLTQFSSVVAHSERIKGNLPKDFLQVYTVHDSLGYIIKPKDVHKVVPIMLNICNNPDTEKYFGFQMKSVRMKVSTEVGKNWGELKDYDAWERYEKWV